MKTPKLFKGLLAVLSITLLVIHFIPDTALVAFCTDCLSMPDHVVAYMFHVDPNACYAAAPLVTIFSKEVEEKIGPDNSFYLQSVDESSMLNGKTVRRNVGGDDPEAITNPTQFPLVVEETEEDSNDYDIALHATTPQRIADESEYILNFPRRQVITNAHSRVLNTKVADEFVFNWSPALASHLLPTSGGATTAVLAAKGATGNRKSVTANDWIDAGTKLMNMDAWDEDMMWSLVHANHYGQLKKLVDFIDYNKTGRADMLKNGVIGEINGIKIKVRSKSAVYTAGNAKKRLSTATSTDDNAAILIWSAAKVYRAVGPLETYWNPKQGQYLGGTLNFAIRAGGNIRKDELGVVAITEAAA